MANVANTPQFPPAVGGTHENNVYLPVVGFTGPITMVAPAAITRGNVPEPDPQHGSTIPLGPQRWPL
jgi:hypothetical protein